MSHRIASVLGLAALASICLAGCEQQSEADVRLAEAQRAFATLASTPGMPLDADRRVEIYNQALSSLTRVGSDATDGQRGAASRMTARARAGLGLVAFNSAVEEADRIRDGVIQARIRLDRYIEGHALADALSGLDVNGEVAEFRDRRTELEGELEEARAGADVMGQRIEGLRTQADALASEARTLRDEAGSIRNESLGAPARQRAENIERAVGIESRATDIEVRAETLMAQVRRQQPELNQAEALAMRLQRQIELLDLSSRQLSSRDQLGESEARAIRDRAAEVARAFDETLGGLERSFRESYLPAVEEARSQMDQALNAYRQAIRTASGDQRTTIQLALATLTQQLGSLNASLAKTTEELAALASAAAATTPRLPETGRYAELAGALRNDADAAREAARAAFAEAGQALDGVRLRDQALQATIDQARRNLAVLIGESTDAEAPVEPS